MIEKEVLCISPMLTETIADLSRRPTMHQYEILAEESDLLARKVKKLEEQNADLRRKIYRSNDPGA